MNEAKTNEVVKMRAFVIIREHKSRLFLFLSNFNKTSSKIGTQKTDDKSRIHWEKSDKNEQFSPNFNVLHSTLISRSLNCKIPINKNLTILAPHFSITNLNSSIHPTIQPIQKLLFLITAHSSHIWLWSYSHIYTKSRDSLTHQNW